MLINVNCAKCIGIQAVPVTVEIDISSGIGIHLVGLADVAVKESLLRTMTALQSMGFRIPGKKIVINLAPADVRKNGSGYDVPIAIGIIAASGQRELPGLEKYLIMGELGLDASIRAVPGALPIAEFASAAGFKGCILPEESAYEAAELPDTEIYGVRNLDEVLRILGEEEDVSDLLIGARTTLHRESETPHDYMDLSEIAGQEGARRGIEIAASQSHNGRAAGFRQDVTCKGNDRDYAAPAVGGGHRDQQDLFYRRTSYCHFRPYQGKAFQGSASQCFSCCGNRWRKRGEHHSGRGFTGPERHPVPG